MGLLGPSIADLQDEQPGYKFTIGTVLRVGLHALRVSFKYVININSQFRLWLSFIEFGLCIEMSRLRTSQSTNTIVDGFI